MPRDAADAELLFVAVVSSPIFMPELDIEFPSYSNHDRVDDTQNARFGVPGRSTVNTEIIFAGN